MKVTIFQPTYLSWMGYYKAIEWSDKFVFLDDVQFEKSSWQNRNRIKSAAGEIILTVPVIRKFPQKINEVKINYSQNWIKKHLNSIKFNYYKAPFFKEIFPLIDNFYKDKPENLANLNMGIIKSICNYLRIEKEFYYSSKLNVQDFHKNEKIIFILKKMNADQYLFAEGSTGYMEEEIGSYKSAGIKLISLKFDYPYYNQLYGKFISHLSIIDTLFNCGRDKTAQILKNINLLD